MVDVFATIAGLCLLLGFLTPYCAAVSCLAEGVLCTFSGLTNGFHLGMSALTAAAVAVLGPGAYSLDARIFGRKRITIPPRRGL
jgi:uncharacterized membrane protein YphA (DoxX/SURF4 family)